MSTVTPIFFMHQFKNVGMTTTYRNFKKSVIFCFKIFEFLCCTEYGYSAGYVRTERILVYLIVGHCCFDLNSL